jgi:hypothetical protein
MHAGQLASIQAAGAVARRRRLTRQKTSPAATSTAAAARARPLARAKAWSVSRGLAGLSGLGGQQPGLL